MRVAQLSWSETTGWASSGIPANTRRCRSCFFLWRATGAGVRRALSRTSRDVSGRSHTWLQHRRANSQRRRHRRRDRGGRNSLRWDQIACRQRGGAVAGKLARMRRKNRPRVGGARPCRHFRSFRRPQCQWQRTRRRHCRRRRRARRRSPADWPAMAPISRRRSWVPIARRANILSRRSASTDRRSASAMAAPAAGTSSGRGAASPARAAMCCSSSTAGRRSTFTSAIWARRRRGVFRAPGCCSRFAFSIRSGPITTSFGPFLRWIAKRGP